MVSSASELVVSVPQPIDNNAELVNSNVASEFEHDPEENALVSDSEMELSDKPVDDSNRTNPELNDGDW